MLRRVKKLLSLLNFFFLLFNLLREGFVFQDAKHYLSIVSSVTDICQEVKCNCSNLAWNEISFLPSQWLVQLHSCCEHAADITVVGKVFICSAGP
jgi:hypothetical protein